MTKEDYAKKAFQWAKALRLLDPNLVLILCGQEGYNSWDHHVLKECVQWVSTSHSSMAHFQPMLTPDRLTCTVFTSTHARTSTSLM